MGSVIERGCEEWVASWVIYHEGLLNTIRRQIHSSASARLLNSRGGLNRSHICEAKGELTCCRLSWMLKVGLSACQEPALRIRLDERKDRGDGTNVCAT
jgi:hypothetical protein